MQKSPEVRFYMLQSIDENHALQKFNIDSKAIIGLDPVKIPEYQNRPQIVTQNKDRMLTFAQFERWGESLDISLARVISENLRVMLPGTTIEMHLWNAAIPLRYQVIVDVVKLESRLDKDIFLAAQWSVIDAQNKKILLMKRSELRLPVTPRGYFGLAKTLSAVCVSLSSEIAEGIASLETKNIS